MRNKLTLVVALTIFLGGCALTGLQNPSTNNLDLPTTTKSTSREQPKNNTLDLSGQKLSKIPDSVFGQTNLETLNVSNNQLTGTIQAEIRHLQNLKVLNASNNRMTGVPAEIGQLQKLEILDLSNNQLTGLPYELGNLQNLKTLNISRNNYSVQDLNIIMEKLPTSVNIIK